MARGKLTSPEIAKSVHVLKSQQKSLSYIGKVLGHCHTWTLGILKNFDGVTGLFEQVCTPEMCATLYDSMPRRLNAVIKAGGYRTKY